MDQTTYTDQCSVSSRTGSARWVSSCCSAPAMAVPGPKQTASSPADTSTLEVMNPGYVISSLTFDPAKASGELNTIMGTFPPSSSQSALGARLPHIPRDGIPSTPMTWEPTSPDLLASQIQAALEAGQPAGGVAPSLKDYAQCPERPCAEVKACCWWDCPLEGQT